MSVDEVLKYFGSGAAVGRELGLCRTTFDSWRMRGYIPRLQQYRIERITANVVNALCGFKKIEGLHYGRL